MEPHFSPEHEANHAPVAPDAGVNAERFRAAVREGIAQADRGELIEDDEVRRWLEHKEQDRDAIDAKIRCGIDQLDRGEGIREDQLDAWLAEHKAKRE